MSCLDYLGPVSESKQAVGDLLLAFPILLAWGRGAQTTLTETESVTGTRGLGAIDRLQPSIEPLGDFWGEFWQNFFGGDRS